MKKFLSLVLALVMTMSLVTVSAGAKDFNDAEDIQYVEAVEVLNLIGVIEGYPDGTFQPKKVLTRAEAAKIITSLTLTPDVAAELTATAAPFADVAANNWAAGYVAEGVQSGIIAGMGDGTFAPNAQLTGFQFLKMLFCALGYDAVAEGLTGANYSLGVTKLNKKVELTKGNDKFVGNNPVTREEAALYAFNAMKADEVEYPEGNDGMTITVGEVVIETSGAGKYEPTGETLIVDTYDLEKKAKDDDFGREGFYWTDGDDDTAVVYEAADYVLFATETYKAKEDATALEQLVEDYDLEDEIDAGTTLKAEIAIGTVVELWLDKDDEVDAYITYTYAKDTIVSVDDDIDEEDHEYEVGISAIYEFEDLDEYTYVDAFEKCDDKNCKYCKTYKAIGEFEEDDVVLLTINEDGKAVAFDEIETVEGEVESKKAGYIKVDGEKYFTELKFDFDKDYTFYLDANGIIFDAVEGKVEKDDEDEDKEYVYVLKAELDEGAEGSLFKEAEDPAAKIKVMYVDGETEVVDYCVFENDDEEFVFEFNGKEVDVEDFEDKVKTNAWYSFEEHDGMICLTEEDFGELKVSDARSWANGLRANADTELVLLDKDGVYETYTGREDMPEMTLANALVILDGKTVVAVYNYAKEYEEEAETIDVAMFVELGEETADGTEATFYVAGEKETYIVAEKADELVTSYLYEIEVDEDDIATVKALSADSEDIVVGEVTFIDGEYFEIGDTDLEMAEDCAVYQLNKDADKISAGTLKKGVNVVVILDSEGDAVEIFQYKGAVMAFPADAE